MSKRGPHKYRQCREPKIQEYEQQGTSNSADLDPKLVCERFHVDLCGSRMAKVE